MAKNSDSLIFFMLGALAGGVTALLMAPDKGEVTRQRIRDKSSDLYGRGHEAVDHGRQVVEEKAQEYTEVARETAHKATETAKAKSQQVTGAARSQMDAVKEAISEGKDAYQRELNKG